MLTVRLQRKPVLLLVLVSSVVLVLYWGFAWQSTEFYSAAELLTGGWGERAGEFGRGESDPGPVEFCLDESGALYIVDGGNHRLQVYNRHGRRQRELLLPEGSSFSQLTVDEAGNLYTVDIGGEKIVKLSPSGEVLDNYRLGDGGETEKRELYTVEDLQAGEPGGLYVQEAILYRYSVVYRLRRLDTRVGEWKLLHAVTIDNAGGVKRDGDYPPERKVNSFAVNRHGDIYLESRAGERVRQLDLLSRRWSVGPGSLVVMPGQEKILRVTAAGADARGRVYLHVNPGLAGSLLCRIDRRQEAVPLLPDLIINLPPAVQRIRVDRKGNIFLLRTEAEGLTVEKYTIRIGLRRRPG